MKIRLLLAAVLMIAAASGVYSYLGRGPKLDQSDTVLLADFRNTTGDPVFDGSLREALGISLAQSPYLNILSPEKMSESVTSLGHSTEEPLQADLAQKVCQHAGGKVFVAGGIARDESHYAILLEIFNCATGSRLAKARADAPSRQQVLHALGSAARELRKEFGEPPDSIQQFDTPLERAVSPSLEAVKLFSEGRRLTREKGSLEGIAPLKEAVDIDARFALAYSSLAVSHYNLNQNALAAEEIRQAFEMGDRQTARERLQITTLYYDLGTGDVQKAIASYKQWCQMYPRDDVPRGDLSSEYFLTGDYEQAATDAKEALRLEPNSTAWYENLSTAEIALLHLDEAQSMLNEAFAKKLDDSSLHANVYALAFLRDDYATMGRELASAAGKAGGEDMMLALQADTEAYSGHLKKARELSTRAVESARKAQLAEPAAIWQGLGALREAAFGNRDEARKWAEGITPLAPNSRDAEVLAALVLARAGEGQRSQTLVDDLRARYVSNTLVQVVWIPTIRAQAELADGNPQRAVELLETPKPYERGEPIGNLSNCCMLPVYLRGEAYLGTKQGARAQVEFGKIRQSRGIVVNCWAGSLALLGQARAQALSGNSAAARTAYQQFFSQWNSADSDIPVLKAARAEYAKLK
jgi:eukaryotic-like serine/threonine-protein kinase